MNTKTNKEAAELNGWFTYFNAKEDYYCCECGKPIKKGEKYNKIKEWSDDDEITLFRTCLSCAQLRYDLKCPIGSVEQEVKRQYNISIRWHPKVKKKQLTKEEE